MISTGRRVVALSLLTALFACADGSSGESGVDAAGGATPRAEDTAETVEEVASDGLVYGLPQGRWRGTAVPPEGTEIGVSFNVTEVAGRPHMYMSVPGVGVKGLYDVETREDAVAFSFDMESEVRCEVERQPDGNYAGDCSSDQGPGSITMIPPANWQE